MDPSFVIITFLAASLMINKLMDVLKIILYDFDFHLLSY